MPPPPRRSRLPPEGGEMTSFVIIYPPPPFRASFPLGNRSSSSAPASSVPTLTSCAGVIHPATRSDGRIIPPETFDEGTQDRIADQVKREYLPVEFPALVEPRQAGEQGQIQQRIVNLGRMHEVRQAVVERMGFVADREMDAPGHDQSAGHSSSRSSGSPSGQKTNLAPRRAPGCPPVSRAEDADARRTARKPPTRRSALRNRPARHVAP